MRISDWSSDVCSSDLQGFAGLAVLGAERAATNQQRVGAPARGVLFDIGHRVPRRLPVGSGQTTGLPPKGAVVIHQPEAGRQRPRRGGRGLITGRPFRSEEHTSELQSLMRISYAVFCLKKKKQQNM